MADFYIHTSFNDTDYLLEYFRKKKYLSDIDDRVELTLRRKLPSIINDYAITNSQMQSILSDARQVARRECKAATTQALRDIRVMHDDAKQMVERETRNVMRNITSEDQYQNPIFGEFKNNLKRDCDKTLKETKAEMKEDINSLKKSQTFNTLLTAGLGIGLLAILSSKNN